MDGLVSIYPFGCLYGLCGRIWKYSDVIRSISWLELLIHKTSFNLTIQKTSFNQGGRETSFDIGGMRTGFEVGGTGNEFGTRGADNEIQQVRINGMTHTRGIDNILSVQFGSDKNHISVDQRNQPAEGYVMFLVTHFLEKV